MSCPCPYHDRCTSCWWANHFVSYYPEGYFYFYSTGRLETTTEYKEK